MTIRLVAYGTNYETLACSFCFGFLKVYTSIYQAPIQLLLELSKEASDFCVRFNFTFHSNYQFNDIYELLRI